MGVSWSSLAESWGRSVIWSKCPPLQWQTALVHLGRTALATVLLYRRSGAWLLGGLLENLGGLLQNLQTGRTAAAVGGLLLQWEACCRTWEGCCRTCRTGTGSTAAAVGGLLLQWEDCCCSGRTAVAVGGLLQNLGGLLQDL